MSDSNSRRKFNALRLGWTLLVLFTAVNIGYTIFLKNTRQSTFGLSGPVRIALTVGSQDPYWEELIAGAEEAAKKHDVILKVQQPEDMGSQTRFLNGILTTKSADAVALSPVNADRQREIINTLSGAMDVVTIDSDAPTTRRKFYIGTHNYDAGRKCGNLIREAFPDGGKVMISVGSLEKQNGQERCQGLLDALFDRERDRDVTISKDLTQQFEGGGYTVVLYSDGTDPVLAKANVLKAINEHTDMSCIVGIYGYSAPQALAALGETDKLGAVSVIGFDIAPETLQGIRDGNVIATLVQNTRQYGYDAVWTLAKTVRKDNPPTATNRLHLSTVLNKDNLNTLRNAGSF